VCSANRTRSHTKPGPACAPVQPAEWLDRTLRGQEFGAASFKLGLPPKSPFPTRLEFASGQRQYDVSADGKRFLLAHPLEQSASVPITVIVNWSALLKKGVGGP
jgi:hypothetical protein